MAKRDKKPSVITLKKAIAKKEYEAELLRIELEHAGDDSNVRYNTHAIGFQVFTEYDDEEL